MATKKSKVYGRAVTGYTVVAINAKGERVTMLRGDGAPRVFATMPEASEFIGTECRTPERDHLGVQDYRIKAMS